MIQTPSTDSLAQKRKKNKSFFKKIWFKVVPSRLVSIRGTGKKKLLWNRHKFLCVLKKAIFFIGSFKIDAAMMWGENKTSKNKRQYTRILAKNVDLG